MISSISSDNLIFYLLNGILFISFSCLIAIAKPPGTILNKSSENGHIYPVPDFKGKASAFPHSYDVGCVFAI
jgi:hypothetical protein